MNDLNLKRGPFYGVIRDTVNFVPIKNQLARKQDPEYE